MDTCDRFYLRHQNCDLQNLIFCLIDQNIREYFLRNVIPLNVIAYNVIVLNVMALTLHCMAVNLL